MDSTQSLEAELHTGLVGGRILITDYPPDSCEASLNHGTAGPVSSKETSAEQQHQRGTAIVSGKVEIVGIFTVYTDRVQLSTLHS